MDEKTLNELIELIKQGDETATEALREALRKEVAPTPEEQEAARVQADLQRLGIVPGGAPHVFGGGRRAAQAQAGAEGGANVATSKETWRSDRDRVTVPPRLWKEGRK